MVAHGPYQKRKRQRWRPFKNWQTWSCEDHLMMVWLGYCNNDIDILCILEKVMGPKYHQWQYSSRSEWARIYTHNMRGRQLFTRFKRFMPSSRIVGRKLTLQHVDVQQLKAMKFWKEVPGLQLDPFFRFYGLYYTHFCKINIWIHHECMTYRLGDRNAPKVVWRIGEIGDLPKMSLEYLRGWFLTTLVWPSFLGIGNQRSHFWQ